MAAAARSGAVAPTRAGPAERSRPITVLANLDAGRRRPLEEAVRGILAEAGVAARILPVDAQGLRAEAARAARDGDPVLAVCGGDGSHGLAAGVLAGSHTALALLPTGTVNTFARRLGMPDLESAARALAAGDWRLVPLGRLDDLTFVSTATFGEYARVVRRRERLRRWLPKWPAAMVAFALTLARLRHLEVALQIDGAELRRRTSLVWLGIGAGTFPLPQRAPAPSGPVRLEVAVLRPGGRLRMSQLLLRLPLRSLLVGEPPQAGELELFHAHRLRLSARHRIGVTLDGEVRTVAPPAEAYVVPEALRVIAP
jgi:diacylglycerol kinase family enzyme